MDPLFLLPDSMPPTLCVRHRFLLPNLPDPEREPGHSMRVGDPSTKGFLRGLLDLKQPWHCRFFEKLKLYSLVSEDVCNEGGQEILPEWRRSGGPGIWTIRALKPWSELTTPDIFFRIFRNFSPGSWSVIVF